MKQDSTNNNNTGHSLPSASSNNGATCSSLSNTEVYAAVIENVTGVMLAVLTAPNLPDAITAAKAGLHSGAELLAVFRLEDAMVEQWDDFAATHAPSYGTSSWNGGDIPWVTFSSRAGKGLDVHLVLAESGDAAEAKVTAANGTSGGHYLFALGLHPEVLQEIKTYLGNRNNNAAQS